MDLSKIAEILAIFPELLAKIEELKLKLADVEAFVAAEKTASFDAGKLAGFEEGKVAGYAIGFEEGKNSVPVVTPGGFTQEQVDAMIAEQVEPLKKSLAEKEIEIATLKEAIPLQINEQVQIALAALKADLLAKLEAQQAAETEGEISFKELLK